MLIFFVFCLLFFFCFSNNEPYINVGAPITYDIGVQFLEFSTGNPHPHACEHRIFVMNTEWEKPSLGIEIVGDNLVLILSHMNGWRPDNRIFIYQWKTGLLKVVLFSCRLFSLLVVTRWIRSTLSELFSNMKITSPFEDWNIERIPRRRIQS